MSRTPLSLFQIVFTWPRWNETDKAMKRQQVCGETGLQNIIGRLFQLPIFLLVYFLNVSEREAMAFHFHEYNFFLSKIQQSRGDCVSRHDIPCGLKLYRFQENEYRREGLNDSFAATASLGRNFSRDICQEPPRSHLLYFGIAFYTGKRLPNVIWGTVEQLKCICNTDLGVGPD